MWRNGDNFVSILSINQCTDSFIGKAVRDEYTNPVTCTDKVTQTYIQCLHDQNVCTENKVYCTTGWNDVRGEILETFILENEIEGDDQHSHSKTDDECTLQKVSFDNTLCKTRYKSRINPEIPRKVSFHFPVWNCNQDASDNFKENNDSSDPCCHGHGETTSSLAHDSSSLDLAEDSLDIHLRNFVNYCNAKYHYSGGNTSHGAHEIVNCVESDGDHSNVTIVAKDVLYNRADSVVLNETVIDVERYTVSHDLIYIDPIPNEDKTNHETFANSLDSRWNSDEGSYASNETNGKSCTVSINISCDNENYLEDPLSTADSLKKYDVGDDAADNDTDDDDNKEDEHMKKYQRSLARDYTDRTSKKVESTGITSSHYEFIKTNINEELEPLTYDDLNKPQSDIIVLHLNSKLGIVPNVSFSPSMRFGFGGISHPRESKMRLTLSGCSKSVQQQLDGIRFSELGIDKIDLNCKLGTLARESDDDENPFKQRLGLRWIFQYGLVPQGSVLRLQDWLRHQLYPFTNIKDFWTSLGSDSPPSLQECMSVEWMRYQSFQNYPISAHSSTSRLARDGFYYTGQGTQIRCFSCGIAHSDWNGTDNPREVHQRLSPNCPFINGREERYPNIPMSLDGNVDVSRADSNSIPLQSPPIAPLSGLGTSQSRAEGRISVYVEGSRAINDDNSIKLQQSTGSVETTPTVQNYSVAESAQSETDNRPKFPEHDSLPSRIATFSHGWPPYLDQTPQQMAEAGFFYTGNQDYTKCYHCGGGLRNWEPGDNPWIEHCRWYPMCPHVLRGKGQRFVHAVLKKQAELLAAQRAECRRKAQYGSSSADPLETLAAITVLEMGYPRDTVRNTIVILRRQREAGADITAQEVLEFIWKEEDIERRRQEEEASRPHPPRGPQAPALPTIMENLNLGDSPAVTQAGVQQSASVTTTTSFFTKVAMSVSATS
ncbi:hypothetical protein ACJMK2_028368, partial [Sinanodonta woodiana]